MTTLKLPADCTVAQALQAAKLAGVERLEAQMLLLFCCQQSLHARAWLITNDQMRLTPAQCLHYIQVIEQRLDQRPVAYITGVKEFFGLELCIDERVLDPRADTEILVEWALACLPPASSTSEPIRVLDLGTGSGAIALAIQSQRPDVQVWALDASLPALEVAQHNAQRLSLPVNFLHGHWFDDWISQSSLPCPTDAPFDLIVSNPPYIADDDPHMAALRHEPCSALTAGSTGLDDIQQITSQAPYHLKEGGWLLLEHGWKQSLDVQKLLQDQSFSHIQSRVDLAGIERATGGQWLNVK
jgi:release factor glutamine methyltransferase